MSEMCEPRTELCPACGEKHTYHCGRLLLLRDPTDPEQACPDETMLCIHCADAAGEFLQSAYDGQGRTPGVGRLLRRERRKPTKRELANIISRRPVVRKIPRPEEFRRFVEGVVGAGDNASEKKEEGTKRAKR